MPTDSPAPSAKAGVALFLFAHQDDEFGVFQQILIEKQRGRRVVCMYFTSGARDGGDPGRRNRESLGVLSALGVPAADVFFAGQLLGIPDGALQEHIPAAAAWLSSTTGGWLDIHSIYLMAWEGGHPDHDVLHAIGLELFQRRGLARLLRQFSLYNGCNCPWQFFRVLSPLRANGPSEASPISWPKRLHFLSLCLRYPSQRVTWIGLFPFVLLHYVLNGRQELQAVSLQRIDQRPHAGMLYYEKRKFSTWEAVASRLAQWRAGLD
jgi:LmbE family N-acetylglucosaminyl deacetylase